MHTDPDIELMLQCKKGDTQAFKTLFERYKSNIMNYCFRFCSDRGIAEDLAQEVFLRMYRAAPKYRPDAAFRTWLFTIATNVCINAARKKRNEAGMISIDAPGESENSEAGLSIPDPSGNPADRFLDQEHASMLQKGLAKLPEKQRAALILRIHHDFSYREIAGQIGCSETSVKTLIHRGRRTLAEILTPYLKE